MRIRSITCFVSLDDATSPAAPLWAPAALAREIKAGLEAAGFPVQTVRLATQPLTRALADRPHRLSELSECCREAGFDYLSTGPVVIDAADPRSPSDVDEIVGLICGTDVVFASVLLRGIERPVEFQAIERMAHAIREVAHATPGGLGNLRLAMLCGVGPLCPFFPAAYHDGGPPAVALAVESADVAVEAFSQPGTLADLRARLSQSVQQSAAQIAAVTSPLAAHHGHRFAGIDFSWAHFPEEARSIGHAMERLGVDCFGAPGTICAASLLTESLRTADYPHTGFNGLMLPVLEDATLAARSLERTFSVNDLLLYSTVCGTGLDTVPLPGDVGEDELAAILLDVAALAFRLNKPLTARLMPIPGAKAGDLTNFDFPFFANGRVLKTKGCGCRQLFARATSSE